MEFVRRLSVERPSGQLCSFALFSRTLRDETSVHSSETDRKTDGENLFSLSLVSRCGRLDKRGGAAALFFPRHGRWEILTAPGNRISGSMVRQKKSESEIFIFRSFLLQVKKKRCPKYRKEKHVFYLLPKKGEKKKIS